MVKRVERTRNAGTWTEAQYWGSIRSHLRKGFRFWKPIMQAKEAVKRPAQGGGRLKWQYQCAACKGWFKSADTQVDHIVPLGSLRSSEDLPGFVERLTSEDGYQLLCRPCHQEKTNSERRARKGK